MRVRTIACAALVAGLMSACTPSGQSTKSVTTTSSMPLPIGELRSVLVAAPGS
ncbi:hypothetical protein ACSDQ9_09685 [Aestuariimicrobium soli]|uniref:hypothetical protein n=1 Tax=Aestuariimicrobium soli TaxID=2035834 RepID=UPI003EC0C949